MQLTSGSTLSSNVPSRAALRKLLYEVLRTDADFEAFCLDHFHEIHRRFCQGMDRQTRINLLMELSDPASVWMQLRESRQTEMVGTEIENVLIAAETPKHRRMNLLHDEIERLYIERELSRKTGISTRAIEQKLVTLKRELRQGPHLTQGEVLGDRYRLLEVIGRGGFAKVWQAFDRQQRCIVAVKVLHSDLCEDSRRLERFARGARQMQAMDHPRVVRLLDGPADDAGFHYFVMEYLPSGDLARAVQIGQLEPSLALQLILQIGEALEYAHSQGLIHRDIKPQNILLDGTESAKLTDFDLVWASDTTGGTRTGALGTFLYAAPEALEDAKGVDARSDVYSLAMTTLFVVHGRPLPQRAVLDRTRFIDRLVCPEALKEILYYATAIDPSDRPPTMALFCSSLLQFAKQLTRNSFAINRSEIEPLDMSADRPKIVPIAEVHYQLIPSGQLKTTDEVSPPRANEPIETRSIPAKHTRQIRETGQHRITRWPWVVAICIVFFIGVFSGFLVMAWK